LDHFKCDFSDYEADFRLIIMVFDDGDSGWVMQDCCFEGTCVGNAFDEFEGIDILVVLQIEASLLGNLCVLITGGE
jgi:hypothetical protein